MLGIKTLFQNSLKPEIPDFTAPGAAIDQIPLPACLRIRYGREATGFDFEAQGEFPRRVRQGDVLALDNSFPLLAPLSGLVLRDEENKILELKMEGAFRLGGDVQDADRPMHLIDSAEKGKGKTLFLEKLRDSGIPSLDFKSRPLFALFEKALEHAEPLVIMSHQEPDGAVNWDAVLGERKQALGELTAFLERTLNTIKVLRGRPAFMARKTNAADYGRNLPEVVTRRTMRKIRPLEFRKPLEEQGIVYLGPATLRTLLAFLNEGTPFVERLTAIRFQKNILGHVNKSARRTLLYRLPNGFALSELLNQALTRPERCDIVQGDIFRHETVAADAEEWNIFDGYRSAVFHVVRRVKPAASDLPCSGCSACENVCPVDASPLSLVEGRPDGFRMNECLLCGLCDYVCDSRIRVMDAVEERRKAEDIPTRQVW